ncbi:MAG: hypothetical protein OZSIB_1602 [Candidatus Ozemobacter sibiricus]|uniref:Uncharacterized protein n=1 Tax=Candidatus Ozemobacter sibiricus TaxID=2268124 RepID=A0A367ZJD5_9BACT|nr:MAG: hypothetical protein OZSIB_1602 [Candidatus Ozemobacter sibiricus]
MEKAGRFGLFKCDEPAKVWFTRSPADRPPEKEDGADTGKLHSHQDVFEPIQELVLWGE